MRTRPCALVVCSLAMVATHSSVHTRLSTLACPRGTHCRAQRPQPRMVIVPDSLPTFGLSEREQWRLSHMSLPEEPLPQEIFGLQVLAGTAGSQAAGFIGAVMAATQLAPCLCFMPGRVGNAFRLAGWHSFVATRHTCKVATSAVRATVRVTMPLAQRFDEATSARVRAHAASLFMMQALRTAFAAVARALERGCQVGTSAKISKGVD